MNWLPAHSLLAKLQRDLKPGYQTFEADAIEWIGEALGFIGVDSLFKSQSVELESLDYYLTLPTDCRRVDGITKDGEALIYRLDYWWDGDNLACRFEKEKLTVCYKVLNTDEDGYPMIPDESAVLEALTWYVLGRLIMGGLTHPQFDFNYCQSQWKVYCKQAANALKMPTPQEKEYQRQRMLSTNPHLL